MTADDSTTSIGGRVSPQGPNLAQRKVDPLIGTVFADRYQIIEVLGRGGMGVVYKARHEHLDRMVAIKMMLPQLVCDETSMARFQREARAASRLNHPNIIAIHDFGITSDTGIAYLVMDYLQGESLSSVIHNNRQLGTARSVAIFMQVCDALAHAHGSGIIHRDLKPSNIMLIQQAETSDFVKVVDFGVAKISGADNETDQQRLTGTGEIFGSPVYMSPEQCNGMPLDARSDIYALGCVLYETLTGKLPCVGRTPIETITKHMNSVPPPFAEARPDLYIPEWMEQIVFKALDKDPDKRQQSMKELFDELAAAAGTTRSSSNMKVLSSSARTRLESMNSLSRVMKPMASPPRPATATNRLVVGILVSAVLAVVAAVSMLLAIALHRQDQPAAPAAHMTKTGAAAPQQAAHPRSHADPPGTAAQQQAEHPRSHADPPGTAARQQAEHRRSHADTPGTAARQQARQPHSHARLPQAGSTAPEDPKTTAQTPGHRRGEDFYDFEREHENFGNGDNGLNIGR